MADHFYSPNVCDDADFKALRYRNLVSADHPVRFIDKFIESIDVTSFQARYCVADGKTGRAPFDVRLLLKVILYAIFCRIYSARKIDYATENYADFWFFTYGERISHDKISDFINLHEEDIHHVFLATISLAHKNELLSFKALYQDGYMLRANASRKRSLTMEKLNKFETKISDALDGVLVALKAPQENEKLQSKKENFESKLARIGALREQLQEKIAQRSEGTVDWKHKQIQNRTTINMTDPDSDLMHQKDDSRANSFLKVSAVDSKEGLVVASSVSGYNDEPHMALDLFKDANENCTTKGSYDTVVADSNFTSAENCVSFEQEQISLIGPTREFEFQQRSAAGDVFTYNKEQDCIICPAGIELKQTSRSFDKQRNSTIRVFGNKEACFQCSRLSECTKSQKGYRTVKLDVRYPAQQRVLERYQSEQGQLLYKKRSHLAETPQGDLKQNGKFIQLLRRGIKKVRVDSTIHDIAWNLRRIFNTKGLNLCWDV
jgi:transposase